MTLDWLERELTNAIRKLQVNLLVAVRAAIDAELATYQGPPPATQELATGNPPIGSRVPHPARSPHALTAALRGSIVELVRQRPGNSAHQIARALGMGVAAVRPYLKVLEEDGLLRTALERPDAPGRPARMYFGSDPSVGSPPSDVAAPEAAPSPVVAEAQP